MKRIINGANRCGVQVTLRTGCSRRAASCGVALAVSFGAPALAAAQDAHRSTNEAAPFLSLDAGIGLAQSSLENTQFAVFDGQHTTYHVTGATLGLRHPFGLLYNATAHIFPFTFRGVGFVTSFEGVSLNADQSASATPFGNASTNSNGPSIMGFLAGPEGQVRFGSILFRASGLGGMRATSVGDFTAYEWRLAVRSQADYLFGPSGFTLGVFGGADVYPALGWSVGTSISFAIF